MSYWLLKTEPDCYSWDDLARDRKTTWDGVTNNLALKHIRIMKKGDLAFIYHTGDEKSILGVAAISSEPYLDPNSEGDKISVVDIRFAYKLQQPVGLPAIKADSTFKDWVLLRIGRLGVVPVSEPIWNRIITLSEKSSDSPQIPRRRKSAGASK